MMKHKTISVIIPCYNEEKTIEELLRRVEAADFGIWKKEIIVVDDGSKDSTRSILDRYRNRSGYQIIFHAKNGGKGAAERTAIAQATGDYLVMQDADLEYNPAEIKKLLDVVDATGAPIVFGSRNMESSWNRLKDFFLISMGVWASTKWVNILYGIHLTDAWTCYKLFSREVADTAHFIGNGFEADYIFIGEAAFHGYPIVEVLISHAPRTVAEGKKIRYKDGIYSGILLLMHRLAHLRKPKTDNKGREERLQTVRASLVCPLCASMVAINAKQIMCNSGHQFQMLSNNAPALIEGETFASNVEEHLTGVNWLKSFLKQFPGLYYTIWHIFCPALMLQNGPRRIFAHAKENGLIGDIGCGPERLGPSVINVDVFPFPGVDVVASAEQLPFTSATFDGLVSEAMLEHVPDAKKAANEMIRVLKPGGVIYASAPFIHPYHASPDDFSRFTTSGLKELFPGFEVIELGVRSGPWSAFLLFLTYWLGVMFSFGSKRLAPFLAHVFMLILGPLKIFDLFFAKFPGAEAVSANLYIMARKPKQ